MFGLKAKQLQKKKVKLGNQIYETEQKTKLWSLKYRSLCHRKEGATEYALRLREAVILADREIERLKYERKLVELELKTFST